MLKRIWRWIEDKWLIRKAIKVVQEEGDCNCPSCSADLFYYGHFPNQVVLTTKYLHGREIPSLLHYDCPQCGEHLEELMAEFQNGHRVRFDPKSNTQPLRIWRKRWTPGSSSSGES